MTKDFSDLTYRPGNRGITKVLGELEALVMECTWETGSATVRDVHEALAVRGHDLAYTTVMTVMSRLSEKGFLRRTPEGNAFRYHPTTNRQEFMARAAKEVFAALAKDLSGSVMSAFVEKLGKVESKRLEELSRLIEAKRKKND